MRPPRSWSAETDVVVVGSGFAAFVAASIARGRGCGVVMLEADDEVGGMMRISSGEYWVPNNPQMRAAGIADPKEDCLRLMARLSYPSRYDPNSSTLGIPARTYRMFETYYDVASVATEELNEIGAMGSVFSDGVTPDAVFNPQGHIEYHSELPENKVEYGRAMMADTGGIHGPGQGQATVDLLYAHSQRAGIEVRTGHRVEQAFVNAAGEVVGVAASTALGTVTVRARKAVIFASGGFFHDEELRTQMLRGTVWGVTAPKTNTGVFLRIAQQLGAMTENIDSVWWGQMAVEEVRETHRSDSMAFWLYGDSMVLVNRHGVRVVNEKAHYNERGRIHTVYDATTKAYENTVLFQVYDDALAKNPEMGVKYPVPYPGQPWDLVISGDTWEELAEAIDERLAKLAGETGGLRLAPDFAANLAGTVARFNTFAESGHDEDFGRGTAPGERGYSVLGLTRGVNRTMYPFASTGPYHAILIGAAAFDTNGGPSINERAQVIDSNAEPIPGLYGAGNCVGSPGHGAYWSGGATLGNALVWAYQAGVYAAAEPVKEA
ncbi:FAD-binding protein [Dactylosporangium fulvum]|uniref:FAD-binding protein n=1 Tax=Dactylosporangium fulvum TaxID=53359 RepID=A0ABY5WB10_9ACTN|nr:FAD-binding protein [Dactylosporangium fulvum]UWP86727.1 FAD-binding protein [Dactylosporangium fulvum]